MFKFVNDFEIRKIKKEEFGIYLFKPLEDKGKVLKYLKSFPKAAMTTASVVDVVTKKESDLIDDAYSDGVFTWYESEIYHFEKYDMKLSEEFLEYVRNGKSN